MANKGPLTSEERLEIVEVLKKGNLSHREIAKRFGRAQSTISMLAREAGITPTHRRRRTAAAKDPDSTYSREERVAIADRALGVLNDLLSSGGLNPRELKDVTAALKQTLDARRSEDFPEQDEKGKSGEDDIYWDPVWADPDDPSVGIGYDPKTKIGREMIEFSKMIDEGRDPYAERCAREMAEREAKREKEREQRES